MSSLRRRLSWSRKPERSASVESLDEYGVVNPVIDLDEPNVTEDVSVANFTFQCTSLVTENVTIFGDRADVTRKLSVNCNEKGTFEVSVTGISLSTDDSSIRVATSNPLSKILEVSVKKIATTLTPEKKKQIEDLMKEKDALGRKLERMKMQLNWLQSYASSTSGVPMPPSGGIAPVRINTEEAGVFLQFYSQKLEETIEGKEELSTKIVSIDKQIAEISRKVESKDIRFVFVVDEPCDLIFSVSYVVHNVNWKPSYDIRVKSSVQNLVELTYNGIITNSSGDNWQEAQISLSTAQPQIGAQPPQLNTMFVRLKVDQPVSSSFVTTTNSLNVNPLFSTASSSFSKKGERDDTSVEKGVTSSSFIIQRKTTIPSNSKPHKVTIKVMELNANFSYTILPRLSKNAYLRANCINDTSYTLLAGKMNVYMDGTFISTSEIKLTNPTDELTLFLGVDQNIVVDFKENFVRENKGIVSKSIINRYSHSVSVKNQKSEVIKVSVFDQLPKSQDSKIKVVVIKPTIRDDDPEIKLNDFNNIRWSKNIDPSQEYKIDFEYTIEFPTTNQLAFN